MTNIEIFGNVFGVLMRAGAMDDFRKAIQLYIDDLARQIADPNMTGQPRMDQVRGELRFCYLLADNAEKALNAQKAAATAQGAGGFQ